MLYLLTETFPHKYSQKNSPFFSVQMEMTNHGLYINLSGLPHGSSSKESACNSGDTGLIPGSERPTGEGNGNQLQYSCLKTLMDIGTWWSTLHGVTKSQTQLSVHAQSYQQLNMLYFYSNKNIFVSLFLNL